MEHQALIVAPFLLLRFLFAEKENEVDIRNEEVKNDY